LSEQAGLCQPIPPTFIIWAEHILDVDEFKINGHEVIEKDVSEHGTGAHVYVPKEWLDDTVKIVRITDNDE
jgi:putative transposon-encoded protein